MMATYFRPNNQGPVGPKIQVPIFRAIHSSPILMQRHLIRERNYIISLRIESYDCMICAWGTRMAHAQIVYTSNEAMHVLGPILRESCIINLLWIYVSIWLCEHCLCRKFLGIHTVGQCCYFINWALWNTSLQFFSYKYIITK